MRFLVVNYDFFCITRYMYWSNWDTPAQIEKATLGGNFRVPIVNTSLVWPSGLTLDYDLNLLYWVDTSLYVSLITHVGSCECREQEVFLWLPE